MAAFLRMRAVPVIGVHETHSLDDSKGSTEMLILTAEEADTSGRPQPVTLIGSDGRLVGGYSPGGTESADSKHRVCLSHIFDGNVTPESLMGAAAGLARADYVRSGKQLRIAGDVADPSQAQPARSTILRLSKGIVEALEGGGKAAVHAVTLGALLGDYAFDRYKTDRSKIAGPLQSLKIVSDAFSGLSGEDLAETAAAAAALGSGSWLARDTAAELSDVATPVALVAMAHEIATEARAAGLEAEVSCLTGAAELEAHGLRMFAAVGQAAGAARESHAPRLIILRLRSGSSMLEGRETQQPIACLGKAVTFDSGGLNLKPTGSIETMHMDKGGGAAVLGAALAAIRGGAIHRADRDIIFAVAAAENAIGALSYKPHAIIESAKGTTVEVSNTDAEGRLVLADAMTHLQREHGVGTLVDVATLTGACVVALGQDVAGLFSNTDTLAESLARHGARVGEPVWRLPVLDGHREALKGTASDLRSTGSAKGGGACTAAAFLEHFVEDGVQWAHLDIAGPGMRDSASGIHCAGATGYASMTLASWIAESTRA